MNYQNVLAGKSVPNDVNVVIEIPANASPIKYEVDKHSNCLEVDRFMSTPMFYPANYGYIPQTLADDGDPLDVLVITPYALQPGCIINCRIVGMLSMSDEKGQDEKLIAVPNKKLTSMYDHVFEYSDLPTLLLQQIQHFFENYKDLEPGKWVKIDEWKSSSEAHKVVISSVDNFLKTQS